MNIREINAGVTSAAINSTPPAVRADQNVAGAVAARSGNDWSTATSPSGRFEIAQLQTINDRQNGIASQIHQDDTQLASAGRILGQMKDQLYQIVKIYPPYPPGDADRVRFLRSFSGLRKQIDNLTIPPASKWQGTQPGTPAAPPKHIAAVSAPAPQPGWGIPTLAEHASDKDVKAALEQVDRTIGQIAAQQGRLAGQADAIQNSRGQQDKITIISQAAGGRWDIGVPGEQDAETLSSTVRSQVAGTPFPTVLGAQPQLAALAG